MLFSFPEIVHSNSKEIILRANSSWAFCINAKKGEEKYYLLKNNFLNQQKLKKINLFHNFVNFVNSIDESNKLELRDYQKEDIFFLSKEKSCGIFNEVRTGKTITALMIFLKWPVKKLLIIVPSILQQQWQDSIERWLNKPAFIITFLKKKQRYFFYDKLFNEDEWIIIVSKDTFKIDIEYLNKKKKENWYFCVIIDEAHWLRNYQSKQSKSIFKIASKLLYKIAITGTPITNHFSDIFGILKFLKPFIFTSYWKFVYNFFFVRETEFKKNNKIYKICKIGEIKDKKRWESFRNYLRRITVSRKQKEILPWLPSIIYRKEKLFMEEKQEKIYLKEKKKRNGKETLRKLTKLKTITLFPPVLNFSVLGVKVNYLLEFLSEKEKERIIIFSTRSKTFLEPLSKILKKKKINNKIITGKTNYKIKNEIIRSFQNKEINLLLCNIKSMGIGITLSQADTIIFADRSYSPSENEQAEARFLPTNISDDSKKVRLIIDLVCQGTIDEKILKILEKKKKMSKGIN